MVGSDWRTSCVITNGIQYLKTHSLHTWIDKNIVKNKVIKTQIVLVPFIFDLCRNTYGKNHHIRNLILSLINRNVRHVVVHVVKTALNVALWSYIRAVYETKRSYTSNNVKVNVNKVNYFIIIVIIVKYILVFTTLYSIFQICDFFDTANRVD